MNVYDHRIVRRWIFAPEVRAALLQLTASDDVLNGRVPCVADNEDYRILCRVDRAKVVGDCEYRPIILNSAEVRVLCVCKGAVRDELLAHNTVLSCLICRVCGC